MTIKNGELADADEVMNALGSLFNDTAQNIFNAAYIGFDSKLFNSEAPNLKNVDYDIFDSDSMNITGNIEYDSTNDLYWGPNDVTEAEYVSYDDCDNSSIDTDLWTVVTVDSATVVETTVMTLDTVDDEDDSAYVESKTLTFGTYSYLMFNVPTFSVWSQGSWTASGTATIKFGGETLFTKTSRNGVGNASHPNMKFHIIKIGDAWYYRKYEPSAWGSWTVFTPSDTKLRFEIYNDSMDDGLASLSFGNVRYNTLATSLASTTDYILSDGITTSEDVTNMIPIVNNIGDGVLIYLSADGGSNWTDVNNTEILRPSNTGTNPKIKILNQGINTITEYAIKYNLY